MKEELLKFKRVMIKLSGEALADDEQKDTDFEYLEYALSLLMDNPKVDSEKLLAILMKYKKYSELGINFPYVLDICKSIKDVHDLGLQIGITVGGGNYWRGKSNKEMSSLNADHIGLLATVMNALTLGAAFEQLGVDVRVQSAISMKEITEDLLARVAISHYNKDRIVVFGAGTGRTNCSTDSGAALNAVETSCNAIIKLTGNVDGIYSEDPRVNKDALKYKTINLQQAISDANINVMDDKAMSDIRYLDIPIIVASLEPRENIYKIITGKEIGTFVSNNVKTEFYEGEEAKFTYQKRLNR